MIKNVVKLGGDASDYLPHLVLSKLKKVLNKE
jgi:hypothetical protein